jgi:hypothetical protein
MCGRPAVVGVDRRRIQVVAGAVDAAVDATGRVVLRVTSPQAAQVLVGDAGEADVLDAGPAPCASANSVPGQRAVRMSSVRRCSDGSPT